MLSHQPVSFLDFVGHLPAPQCWQGESNGGSEIRVERSPRAIFYLLKGRNLPSPFSLPSLDLPDPDLPGPRFTWPQIYPALDLPGPKRGGVAEGEGSKLT